MLRLCIQVNKLLSKVSDKKSILGDTASLPGCLLSLPPSAGCLEGYKKATNGTGLSGRGVQQCANQYVFQCAEDAVEVGLCTFLTGGAGAALCVSPAAGAVLGVVNSFANKYIEAPVVKVTTKLEDAAASAVKSVGRWFSSWF